MSYVTNLEYRFLDLEYCCMFTEAHTGSCTNDSKKKNKLEN